MGSLKHGEIFSNLGDRISTSGIIGENSDSRGCSLELLCQDLVVLIFLVCDREKGSILTWALWRLPKRS